MPDMPKGAKHLKQIDAGDSGRPGNVEKDLYSITDQGFSTECPYISHGFLPWGHPIKRVSSI